MSLIVFPECKSCSKNFIGTSTVLCGACSEQEIASLKEKVKELEAKLGGYYEILTASMNWENTSLSVEEWLEYMRKAIRRIIEDSDCGKKYIERYDAIYASNLKKINELEAQIAVLHRGLEDIGKILDKGGWSRVAEMIVAKTLSSNGSELLEAVRDITEAVEELLEPMPHLLHGVFGENAHADISERIENAEKSLSRLRGLV